MSAKRHMVRVAAAQYPIDRFATLAGYKEKLARWVGEAAQNGAQLLVQLVEIWLQDLLKEMMIIISN